MMEKSVRPRLFLDYLHLQGFKSIYDLKVDINRGLNILIGKNGAGKSNFLECLKLAMGPEFDYSHTPFKFLQLGLSDSEEKKFTLELSRIIQKDILEIERPSYRHSVKQSLFFNGKKIYDNLQKSSFKFDDRTIKTNNIASINHLFIRIGSYRLSPLYVEFNLPKNLECIDEAGNLIISTAEYDVWETPTSLEFIEDIFFDIEMYYLHGDDVGKLSKNVFLKYLKVPDNILKNLKRFTPIQDVRFHENINFYRNEKEIIIDNLKLDFKVHNSWVPWSQLSDGTKRLFYMIAEITNTDSSVILIEEPELGIHPHQFNLTMDFLKEQSKDKQIIISTHSPKALDHLSNDELENILITSYSPKLGTQIKHLSTSQKKKAVSYTKEVGFLSDYWLLSDLE